MTLQNHASVDHLPLSHPSDGIDEFYQVLAIKFERVCKKLERISDDLSGRVKPYYTVDEVAAMTGRSAYTVRRWIADRRISATRIAGTGPKGRLLIARDELSKLMKAGMGDGVPAAAVGKKEMK